MEASEEGSRENLMRRLHCSLAAAPSSLPKQQQHLPPPTQQQQQQHNLFANSFSLLHGDLSSGGPVRDLYSGSFVGFDGNSKSSSNVFPSSIGGGGGDRSSSKRPVGTPPFHPPIPPASPYSLIPTPGRSPGLQSSSQALGQGHARSLSQPAAFFSLDALPPLSPSSYRESPSGSALSDPTSTDVSMEDRDNSSPATATTPPPGPFSRSRSGRMAGGFPPLKAHRRSLSEIPLGFSQSSFSLVVPPLAQKWPQGFLDPPACKRDDLSSAGKKVQGQFLRKDWAWDRGFDKSAEGMGRSKSEADSGEDLLDEYMNLDGQDALNSSGTEEKHEDRYSRGSGTKANGADCSENEAESSVSESVNSLQQLHVNASSSLGKKEGTKRSAVGDPDPNINRSRHLRSVSMDSFMGNMNFGDESPKLPLSPAVKTGQHSHNKSFDGTSNAFSLELGNGEFSSTELNKIMADEKLADIAVADPKRAKRILANRQSAARSKERKLRYISELEHKVQTLQTEATTLSAQLTKLQRDSAGLTSQNNELKFRLQALAQQAQLRDALNEALTAEVRHLKLAAQRLTGANSSGSLTHQLPANPQLFPLHQLHQPQQSQLPMYQLQHIQPQQHQQAQLQNQLQQQEDSLETKMRSESVA